MVERREIDAGMSDVIAIIAMTLVALFLAWVLR